MGLDRKSDRIVDFRLRFVTHLIANLTCATGRLLQSLVCARALCIQSRAPTSKVLGVLPEKTFAKPCVRTGFVYSAVPWKGAIDGSALELAF